jgi:hypothetical protein
MFIEGRELTYKHNIPVTKVEKYWKGLEEGKIYGTECKNCGAKYSPPQADCSVCYSSDMEWIEISGEGEVVCMTEQYSFPAGFEFLNEPYVIAVAKFGDFKVIGWTKEKVFVGDKVVAETEKDETGVWKVYFKKV